MEGAQGKLRIKMGAVEVEAEGSEAFLKDELPKLMETIVDLHARVPEIAETGNGGGTGGGGGGGGASRVRGTTRDIAAKLGAKSGPDLGLAAAAQLTLVEGNESFSRNKLLDSMKSATGFYKTSHRANLTNSIQKLINDNKLSEVSKNTYCLTQEARSKLERQLAQG